MWTFDAMGTQVAVCVPDGDEAAGRRYAMAVARLFATTEHRFSRFLPGSELSRLNRATGAFAASAEMIELLQVCRHFVADTHGMFDPTIGGALCAAGYDRSFAHGALDRAHVTDAPPPARFAELQVDETARIVIRPPHLALDFGGFLKGRTVDRALALLPGAALVDAGGDIAVRDDGPDGDGWLVDIEDPSDPRRALATLRVHDQAIATSAPNRRRWCTGPRLAHHLIDPRSGFPSDSDLAQVTVVAPTAERADVYAKTAFLLGAHGGHAFIADRVAAGVGALLLRRDGTLDVIGGVEVLDA